MPGNEREEEVEIVEEEPEIEEEVKAKKVPKKVKELPTVSDIRKAKKAELVKMCETFGLEKEGKVADLRERLVTHVEKQKEAEVETHEVKYRVEVKPKLDKEARRQLKNRRQIADARPTFLRQEWFRYPRLGMTWRKPRGLQSKMRRAFKYRTNLVSIGYRGPREVRGLHPSGFQEVIVYNVDDLGDMDPKTQAARIGHSVGSKKREEIEKVADEKGIRILNRSMVYEP